MFFEGIIISQTSSPVARIDMEVKLQSNQIRRKFQKVKQGDDLYELSGQLDQYRNFKVQDISSNNGLIKFSNGIALEVGDATGDITETEMRKLQIRETILAHIDREKRLYSKGIKVLSLFFVDSVSKYRDYEREDEKGDYARIFEEQYKLITEEYKSKLIANDDYWHYLNSIDPVLTHKGYFSIDNNNRFKNPDVNQNTAESDNISDYELILKDKELLLSHDEPTRFIFSHSALREGWDNPNVFVICMLKHTSSSISRRQEVGRGLRLCVDKYGNRVDNKNYVHSVNLLTVVASLNSHYTICCDKISTANETPSRLSAH